MGVSGLTALPAGSGAAQHPKLAVETRDPAPGICKITLATRVGWLPWAISDGKKGSCRHGDLLLDILLVSALCVAAKDDPKPFG